MIDELLSPEEIEYIRINLDKCICGHSIAFHTRGIVKYEDNYCMLPFCECENFEDNYISSIEEDEAYLEFLRDESIPINDRKFCTIEQWVINKKRQNRERT